MKDRGRPPVHVNFLLAEIAAGLAFLSETRPWGHDPERRFRSLTYAKQALASVEQFKDRRPLTPDELAHVTAGLDQLRAAITAAETTE